MIDYYMGFKCFQALCNISKVCIYDENYIFNLKVGARIFAIYPIKAVVAIYRLYNINLGTNIENILLLNMIYTIQAY